MPDNVGGEVINFQQTEPLSKFIKKDSNRVLQVHWPTVAGAPAKGAAER